MTNNCVIFGAGFYGKASYHKLIKFYNVQYYVDNNPKLWGKTINGVKVISVDELLQLYNESNMDIWICCRAFMEIFLNLRNKGVPKCYAMVEGFAYILDEDMTPYPVTIQNMSTHYKKNKNEKSILFVQNTACIRTHKIAAVMKEQGWKVYLLYTVAPPSYSNSTYEEIYDRLFTCFTADELERFINESDFDIIHSSNEPDILTSILVDTNKKVVFDTHDMMSMCGYSSIEVLALEYIANMRSDGLMHVTEGCFEFAKKKYPIQNKPCLCIGNFPQYQYPIHNRREKLSKYDGEIHCVYEGGMVFSDKQSARFLCEVWRPFLEQKIHIHFYTNADELQCREYEATSDYLHYEGNKGTHELIDEMTRYDCGLAIFNINSENRAIYENSSANKIFEYINSGLPIATSGLKSYKEFVERYFVGAELTIDDELNEQLNRLIQVNISRDFLTEKKMTMESMAEDIVDFYNKIIGR